MTLQMQTLKLALETAGRAVRRRFGKVGYRLKGEANLVTEADLASQKAAIQVIKKAFPTHDFLGEEDARKNTGSPYTWVIDPIDGTTNFAHTFPQCSVSVALFYKNQVILGGVLNPITNEMFLAQKGKGATLNGKKIHVSNVKKVHEALLVTGFPYNRNEIMPELLHRFENFLRAGHDVRRLGSAALDLCWLAAGRLDGYWEQNLNPWDVAAGTLVLTEAGGKVTDFSGKKWAKMQNFGRQVLASNGKIHAEMLTILSR